jgi:TetR/AcrR family transcriptional repressor of nem operon
MFDEAAVLDAAAAEFRVHGYADTSTEKLCAATGVQRGSLYNAFTSKDELFVQALERYATTYRQRQEDLLSREGVTGAMRLRSVMEAITDEEFVARRHGHGAGCMVVQSTMAPDLRERDQRISRILDHDLRERLSSLEGVIQAGRVDGSIPPDVDPADGAVLFTTVVNGVRVMGQAGTAPEVLRRVALAGIASLVG